MNIFYLFSIAFSLGSLAVNADYPCIPRFFNESSVCVCNSTYCDTISRKEPRHGHYIKYTSTKCGKRFVKNHGVIADISFDNGSDDGEDLVLELNPKRLYQSIEGFGSAVTDSAAINWKSLPRAARKRLIDSYYSKNGIEYNMLRVPIGSSDFSVRPYTYNEYPAYDTKLSNYTLVPEDVHFKVPMIHECQKAATDEIEVITASWAPPNWMLTRNKPSGTRYLNKEYYQTYADYLCRFAQIYYEQDIKIWGLSTANEPILPVIGALKKESMAWTVPDMAKFMKDYLGPTIRNCSVEGIKILASDDQRYTLPLWLTTLSQSEVGVMDYIDGVALHFYGDKLAPGALVARAMKDFPDIFFINSEACEGSSPDSHPKVDLGSWKRAKTYILDILEDLNYNIVGWLDWNMCLNMDGGPTWLKNFVDSPIIVNSEDEEFYKQPMYYAFGHFSKFIPRGSRRIRVVKRFPEPDPYLDLQDIEALGQEYFDNVAFLTPRGTIVVVIHNDGPCKSTTIKIGDQKISVFLDEDSISTIEFPYEA